MGERESLTQRDYTLSSDYKKSLLFNYNTGICTLDSRANRRMHKPAAMYIHVHVHVWTYMYTRKMYNYVIILLLCVYVMYYLL